MKVLAVTILVILLSCSTNSFAQFGKLKVKKPKITKKNPVAKASNTTKPSVSSKSSSSSASSSSSSGTRTKDGAPRYNSDNPEDPVYKAYKKAKENIIFAQKMLDSDDDMERKHSKITKYIEYAKEPLAFLNTQDSEKDKDYLKNLNDINAHVQKQIVEVFGEYQEMVTLQDAIQDYRGWAGNFMNFDREKTTVELSYQGYFKARDAYLAKFADARSKYPKNSYAFDKTKENIAETDKYFAETVYEDAKKLSEKVKKAVADADKPSKVWKGQPKYRLEAKRILGSLKKVASEPLVAERKERMKDASSLDPIATELESKIAMLEDHINNGGLEKAKQEYEQYKIDVIRLGEAGMRNSTYEKMAMGYKGESGDKAMRAVIISTNWQIVKNNLGNPIEKYLYVELALKATDGKCYKTSAKIISPYAGGGKYEKARLVRRAGEHPIYEMNCANVNK